MGDRVNTVRWQRLRMTCVCTWVLACSSACLVVFPRVPPLPPPNKDNAEAIARDYWEVLLSESPVWATSLGDRRFDAVMPDLTASAREAAHRSKEELGQRLALIHAGKLTGEPYVTARVLAHTLETDLGTEVCNAMLWNIDPFSGLPAMLMSIARLQPMEDSSAAAAYLTRLEGVGMLLEQHMANLRDGAQQGYRAPRPLVERMIRQVQVIVTQERLESPFFAVVDRAYGWSRSDLRSFREDIAIVLGNTVYPALRTYLEFLIGEYLPLARHDIALTRNPDGDSCYSALMRRYAGVDADPQALHDLAKIELDEAVARMNEIAAKEGYSDGTAYATALSARPDAYARGRDGLLTLYRGWVRRAREAMPDAFAQAMDTPLELQPVSMLREQDVIADLYEPAPLDAPGRAVLFINTRAPRSRPLFFMEAHAFHQTYPGRHWQYIAAQGAKYRPVLRRAFGDPPMREGWAAYAQVLADEMGLYSGPPARFGMMHARATQAARMAVDTGVHILGWSREDAIRFMRENLLLSDDDIRDEVDRAIVQPARALSHVVGRRFFENLRAEAQRKQGAAFDLKAFHAHLLAEGVPHSAVLSDTVRAWLTGI